MNDTDTQLFQNSVRYLHNLSTLPEANVPTLKSFLCLKRRLMELRKNTFLPSNTIMSHLHCQRCFLFFLDGPANFEIKAKPRKYTFVKKVLNKQKNGLPFTRYQEQYLKKNNKFKRNSLVITCKFCKYENNVKLERPLQEANTPTVQTLATQKKKNKNKKDKFCGLDHNIVNSLTPNKSNATNESDDQYIRKIIPSNKLSSTNELNIIYVDSEEGQSPTKLKMKKKLVSLPETSTPTTIPKKSDIRNRKKDRARGKLTEILKNSYKKKKKGSSNLLQFLESL